MKHELPITMEDTESFKDWIDRLFTYVWNVLAGVGILACVIAAGYFYGLMEVKAEQAKKTECGSCRLSKEVTK